MSERSSMPRVDLDALEGHTPGLPLSPPNPRRKLPRRRDDADATTVTG